jgi:hypothetical protein
LNPNLPHLNTLFHASPRGDGVQTFEPVPSAPSFQTKMGTQTGKTMQKPLRHKRTRGDGGRERGDASRPLPGPSVPFYFYRGPHEFGDGRSETPQNLPVFNARGGEPMISGYELLRLREG